MCSDDKCSPALVFSIFLSKSFIQILLLCKLVYEACIDFYFAKNMGIYTKANVQNIIIYLLDWLDLL